MIDREVHRKPCKWSYTAVLYSKKAQKFIIDNLQEMIK